MMQSFDVFRPVNNKPYRYELIDTVFYFKQYGTDAESVKRDLIRHDGYPADIEVKEGK